MSWAMCRFIGSELLFEVFSQRYERGATLVTSNLPFDEWTSIFGSERLTGCLSFPPLARALTGLRFPPAYPFTSS
jgi:IstB-like ATP binding protein